MPSHNRLPNTIIAESGTDVLLLRQTDAAAKAGRSRLLMILGVIAFLAGVYFALLARANYPDFTEAAVKYGMRSALCLLGGCGLFFTSGYALERESFRFDKDGVIITYRSRFKRARKRYRRAGVHTVAVELIGGGLARGVAVYDGGLGLAFCQADEESARDMADKARALWRLPAPDFLLVNAPHRELFAQGISFGVTQTRDDAQRAAEPLSWQAQGTQKKWAHLGRYDETPAPTGGDDGAFALCAYPHSLWDRAAGRVTFRAPGKPDRVVPFADFAAFGVRVPRRGVIIEGVGSERYAHSAAVVLARLRGGEELPLTTVTRLTPAGTSVVGTEPA